MERSSNTLTMAPSFLISGLAFPSSFQQPGFNFQLLAMEYRLPME
jgi:hypothetical protein